jgi:hypothetical protein
MSKTIYIGFHFIPFLDVDQVYFGPDQNQTWS